MAGTSNCPAKRNRNRIFKRSVYWKLNKLKMLIDNVKIKMGGGDGGKGAVAFNKNMMSLGPVGGSGGNGGNVYVEESLI